MIASPWVISHLSKVQRLQPALVDAALQKLLDSEPELTWSLVVSAYLDEEINLGKAAELLNIHELELRDRFIELGTPLRSGSATKLEALAEVQALGAWLSPERAASVQ